MDLTTYASSNVMFLGGKPLILKSYWQAIKDYKWRVLRLSILTTVLSVLVVNTLPSTYVGTVKLQFSPFKTALAKAAYFPLKDIGDQKELSSIYEEMLSENIAKGILIKLRKFKLNYLDSELKEAISESVIIGRIKQKMRNVLPFMPQQGPGFLSSKQQRMLKNNYTLEKIIQSLQLGYSTSESAVYINYKDQSATFAIIIAKLAADLYVQSVSDTKKQMFESVQKQIQLNRIQPSLPSSTSDKKQASYYRFQISGVERLIELSSQEINKLNGILKQSPDTSILIGNYTTERLKPNRALIVSLSFFLSVFAISSLVLILVCLNATDRQKYLLVAAQKKL
jgi:uncharacterized protein involved in exopolysaccharide biosynthesis